MDPGTEGLDYSDEHNGAPKTHFQGGGAIPALADDEIIGEDDEYDDLYNDVNVGEGFQQMQHPEVQVPSTGRGNEGFPAMKASVPQPRPEEKNPNANTHFPESEEHLRAEHGQIGAISSSQKDTGMVTNFDAQKPNSGFQGSNSVPQKMGAESSELAVKASSGSALILNSGPVGLGGVPPMLHNQPSMNVNHLNNDNIRPATDNGSTMLFVGELHWWTTDAELESVLSQYGRVKEIKFFDERASGKSKGYCQVEFFDSGAAALCKEGMNGHVFNGRACVVAFASPQTIRQMGASYANKNQAQSQPQSQGRRPMNDGPGRGGGVNQQPNGDGGRNYAGRGGWGRGGPGILNRGPGIGPIRGRGGPMGARNMTGSGPGGGAFGQGLAGPAFGGPLGGLMNPQGMIGAGFDPTFMGRGAGYGGFPGAPFPGMLPSFPPVNPMGLAGVAPHVNPAFFSRGMTNNGMGMGMGIGMGTMGPTGMDGQPGMWNDTSMGGGGGEEYGQRTRESSYGGEDGDSEYGYGGGSHEKGARSNVATREKDWGSERDWSGNSERRRRDDREMEKDKSDRNYRYREENDDWDRGQSSSRSRSRSKAVPEEDYRRSRDSDYGKRRRFPSE